MRRTLTRAAGAACLAGAAWLSPLTSAFAQEEITEPAPTTATLLQYGWWNKAQQGPNASSAVPAPPGAPADGIYIAYEPAASNVPGVVTGAPGLVTALPGAAPVASPVPPPPPPATPIATGPEAYGAVRYSVPEGAEGELVLRFKPASNMQPGGVNLDGAGVKACPALSPWDHVQNGRYDGAPAFDCSSFALGNMLGDTITFSLPATLANQPDVFDLVIVPDTAGMQPFQLSIDAPTDSSLLLTSVPEALTEEAFDPSASGDLFEDFMIDGGEAGTEDFFFTDAASSDFFADGSFSAPPTASVAPRPRTQVAVPAGNPLNPFRPDASRGERLVAVAVLLAMAVGLFWLGGQQTRAPRLLGSLGAGTAATADAIVRRAGIGRFARPRGDQKPPRLF